MSKPDDRVVAWALTIERTGCLAWFAAPCTVFPNRKFAECGAEKASEPVAVIPLVPLSLLAEAESRIVALQARLDAVLALADRMEGIGRANWTHPKRKKFAAELRSAALGGE